MSNDCIMEIKDLSKAYPSRSSWLKPRKKEVLKGITLSIKRGQVLGLVGESGSGKSTLARILMKIERRCSGDIFLNCASRKQEINQINFREYSRKVQMVFQDPYASLNPRKKIWQIVTTPLTNHGQYSTHDLFDKAEYFCRKVGLGIEYLETYPSSLSGGQRQRVGIARALIVQPEMVILDEALSALDISIQAQIVNLLMDLQDELGLTYLFISHDMNMVNHFSDEVVVMHSGEIIDTF